MISVLVDVNIFVEFNNMKAGHRFGKLDKLNFQKNCKGLSSVKKGLPVLIAVGNQF